MNRDQQILQSFLDVLPSHKSTGTGWLTFDCPSCGDSRGRGAFMETPSGGFRYTCRNGGCDFNDQPTGWEPGNGLGGRPRRLYQLLGGNLKDLPLDMLFKQSIEKKSDDEPQIIRHFPKMDLPEDSFPLLNPPDDVLEDKRYLDVLNYAIGRSEEVVGSYDFYWSRTLPSCLIIPFFNYGQVVGYLGRAIKGKTKMFQKSPPDYLFRQDTLDKDGRAVILAEGCLDGIALDGVSSKGTKLTKKQINLLNLSGKQIIVVPDQESDGSNLIDITEENQWFISTPDWDYDIKDAMQAVNRYGRLYTIEDIVNNCHQNYTKARVLVSAREAMRG
jgi:hypothetical protein